MHLAASFAHPVQGCMFSAGSADGPSPFLDACFSAWLFDVPQRVPANTTQTQPATSAPGQQHGAGGRLFFTYLEVENSCIFILEALVFGNNTGQNFFI